MASLAYETTEPRKYALEPGISVSIAEARPPVQDSASAIVVPLSLRSRPTTDAERDHWRKNLDLVDTVTSTEDFAACEKIQANLRVGAVPFLLLGRNEPGVAHFHRALHEVLGPDAKGVLPCT